MRRIRRPPKYNRARASTSTSDKHDLNLRVWASISRTVETPQHLNPKCLAVSACALVPMISFPNTIASSFHLVWILLIRCTVMSTTWCTNYRSWKESVYFQSGCNFQKARRDQDWELTPIEMHSILIKTSIIKCIGMFPVIQRQYFAYIAFAKKYLVCPVPLAMLIWHH